MLSQSPPDQANPAFESVLVARKFDTGPVTDANALEYIIARRARERSVVSIVNITGRSCRRVYGYAGR